MPRLAAGQAERLLVIALMLLALLVRWIAGPRTIDDAFITFRYARNLVHGLGFVYNAGERVLGTTTPLYTLLMAGFSLLTGSEQYPVFALVVNSLADAASVSILYRLGRRLGNSPLVGLAAGLLWAISPVSVTFGIGGMETSVFVVLMLATFAAHLEGHPYRAAVLSGLALLARPDAALIIVLVFGQLLVESIRSRVAQGTGTKFDMRKSQFLGPALVLAAVVAPWFIFATFYFGSPLPHSVSAKSLAYRLPPEAGLVQFLQQLSVPFFESDALDLVGLARLVVYLALYAIAGLAAFRRDRRSLPFFAYPVVYVAAFVIANPLIFRWYVVPPLPGYMLGILLGIYQISSAILPARTAEDAGMGRRAQEERPQGAIGMRAAQPIQSFVPAGSIVLGLVALVYVGTSLRTWTLHPDHGPDRPAPEMAYIQLELLYHRVAADVAPHVTRDTVIAAGDIGALGYDTGAHILDTLGLISPQTSRYYPLDPKLYVINYAMPPQLILDQKPEWVVAPEVYLRLGLLPDARFQAQYQLFETIPTDIYGSRGLLVFRRK